MRYLALLLPQNLTREQRIAGAVLFVSYLVAAQLGAYFFVPPAVIIPAAGIALGILTLYGIELWPAVYAAALLSYLLNGSTPAYLVALPVAHTLQAVAGAYILKRTDFDPRLRSLRNMFSFMLVAFAASAIVPTIGVAAARAAEYLDPSFQTAVTWGSWWVGSMLSLLMVGGFVIRWGAEMPFYLRRRASEILSIFAVLLAIDYALFWTNTTSAGGVSLVYFLLVPLSWIAIRIGPRFTILAMLATTVIAIGGSLYGPFAPPAADLGVRIFQLEILLNILAFIFFVIAGLEEERKEATKSLRSYITRLEDALNRLSLQDQAKSDFIAILAHELRNPLAPVMSGLEWLRLNAAGATREHTEALELMDERLRTVNRLLDDLLDVSRISRAKLRLQKKPADLLSALKRSVQSITRGIEARRQTLVLDFPNEPLVLYADPLRIEQVFTNLLNNASKFTPEGGQITLSVRCEGDQAVVRVADTGIGIDPAMLERIFEPFLQLETGQRGEGLGIGLSLTQKLVEMHEGSIEARSEGSNLGSEFVVRLSLMAEPAGVPVDEPTPATVIAPRAKTSGGKLVLVVDDNQAAAHGIGKLLELKGYGVAYAYSGEEAREKVAALSPGAVVLDIGLPDVDGYSLARLLRKDNEFLGTLIALTGYGQEEDKRRAQEAGFDHHLTKPIGINDLLAVLPS
ncbi:MAG TPA: ATP-binding protein [Candidatus Paceibacterota bacterium]|nr:ATP-binding protein [Candidatus Paceibacterota bacterium]